MSPGVREDGIIAQKYAHFSAIPAILYDTEAMVLGVYACRIKVNEGESRD